MDIMLDIETLGTEPGAPVLQIGAMAFDRNTLDGDDWMFEPFKVHVDLQSNFDVDLKEVTAGTLAFWFQQEPALAYDVLFGDVDRVGVFDALKQLIDWTDKVAATAEAHPDEFLWWAKGPDFDMVLLETAARAVGLTMPWKYNSKRDLRTVQDITGNPDKELPIFYHAGEHDALADCEYQIKVLRYCLGVLKMPDDADHASF